MITAVSTTHVTKFMTILIVDDHRANRKLLRAHLEMPNVNGAATLKEIRQQWGLLPVIIHPGCTVGAEQNDTLANQRPQTRR